MDDRRDRVTGPEPFLFRAALLEEATMRALPRAAILLALGLAALSGTASATVCAPDQVPAATLLVPYFEVALDQCGQPASQRLDTEFTVANASASPVLATVTLWSDWGIPVTGFVVYLPGESAQNMTLGEFLCLGNVPQTGPAVSPHPPATDPPVDFPGCNNTSVPGGAPNYANPAAPPYFLAHLQAALTGQPSPLSSEFFGQDWGDNIARGYLTVDAAAACTLELPGAPGYFVLGGLGIALNDNVLVGDYTITDPANNFAYGQPAVGLEADALVFVTGDITFYGRYPSASYTVEDGREPLPSTFASTFALAGIFDSGDQVIWRERTGTQPSPGPFYPAGLPLEKFNVTWFDEASNPFPSFIPPIFPGEPSTELVQYPFVSHAYTPADVPYPVPFGWQYSDLQNVQGSYQVGQSWMVSRSQSVGRYETSRPAVPLDSSCVDIFSLTPISLTLTPAGGLQTDPPTAMISWADFEDYFGGWSAVVGFGP